MKANFQHLGFDTVSESFLCYWVRSDRFGFHWHYHPELEITYVHRGHGMRLVGNDVAPFQAGDFVLLGSNLPHTWISDDDFNAREEQMEVVVLQFPADLFSTAWLNMPEMGNLQRLFGQVERGISFQGEVRHQAADILMEMTTTKGFSRFQYLLQILDLLGGTEEKRFLSSADFSPSLDHSSEDRLLRVCQHIHQAFTDPIVLKDIADLAHMNPSAFCRFFKKMTGKSLMEYVNELRIGKACNLLIASEQHSIGDISYLSGFKSQTLFNRQFLRIKGMSPREFRKSHLFLTFARE